jgi:hypothetical protein
VTPTAAERELAEVIGAAVARASQRLSREARAEAAAHYGACLEALGIGLPELLVAHAAGDVAVERLVMARIATSSEEVWGAASVLLRRTWVALGVEGEVLARWDEVVARVRQVARERQEGGG